MPWPGLWALMFERSVVEIWEFFIEPDFCLSNNESNLYNMIFTISPFQTLNIFFYMVSSWEFGNN